MTMHTRPPGLLHAILVLVAATSCKPPPGREAPDAAETGAGAVADVAPDAEAEPAAGDVDAEPETEAKDESVCGGFQEKDEARRRAEVASLAEPFAAAGRTSALMNLVLGARDAARERRYGDAPDLAREARASLEAHHGTVSEDLEAILASALRVRFGAHATCAALAEADAAACEALPGEWLRERESCLVMHIVYVSIKGKVIDGGGSCEEALADSPQVASMSPADWVSMCEAIAGQDPDLCPHEKGSVHNAICRAAARRDGRGPCDDIEADHAEEWKSCCEKFGWMHGHVLGGTQDSYHHPEVGALAGDIGGCERALVWGIFHDAAAHFGIEGLPPSPQELSGVEDYLCPMRVQWTARPLPGQ